MALYIIGAAAALIALIVLLVFLLNIKINLAYSTVTGEFSASVSVLFVKIPLYPPKPSENKRKKQKNKQTKKKQSRQKQKIKKDLDTAAQKGREAAENSQKESPSQKARKLAGLIKHICISLRELAPGVLGAITLDIKKLDICVGAEDAADAAVNYGIVCGAVEMLLALEQECKRLKVSGAPYVTVDFQYPKVRAEAELVLIVRAYKVLIALYKAEDAYYTYTADI